MNRSAPRRAAIAIGLFGLNFMVSACSVSMQLPSMLGKDETATILAKDNPKAFVTQQPAKHRDSDKDMSALSLTSGRRPEAQTAIDTVASGQVREETPEETQDETQCAGTKTQPAQAIPGCNDKTNGEQ